jgi:hypothetical protein
MWLLNNTTPFAAERTWVRDQNGAEIWLVVVRCCFVIQTDGQQVLATEQTEVSRIPKFGREPGLSSLIDECDLVHTKNKTDVLVYGHAYAQAARTTTCQDIRLKVANIDKTLRVQGDRRWQQGIFGLGLSPPEPFTKMPIVYERAFGGTDEKSPDPKDHRWESKNPVGTGFAIKKEHLIDQLAPNIEYPETPYKDWRKGHAAGFGPIARHWSPRVELAGTFDEDWENTRKPLLPTDFNELFYQCAPEDQQVDGFLKGGELVELYNMTPEGYLSFRLPKLILALTTSFYDGTSAQHRAVFHTLNLYPDQRSFQIVWHSQLPCHHKVNKLKETRITLKKRINVSPDELKTGIWIGE